jgi:cobalt/nickel transport protein
MARTYRLELISLIAIAAFCVVFLLSSAASRDMAFAGTDSIAAGKISPDPGSSPEGIQPLIPQWIPPSPEIESTLFGLQAAVGGMCIGGVFGYWIGQNRKAA